jgi:lipoyl(octanoyl) transferase
MKTCLVTDLGLAEYGSARALEERLVAARKAGAIPDVLLLCEHPHVITQGRNGRPEHLLASRRSLEQMGVAYFETNRGGDITYHGPGQLIGYPILNLSEIRRDVGWYVRSLEEAMIGATREYGVSARRVEGKTGVWVGGADAPEEKLAAIGVHLSRWVTSHGFAYNVGTDLRKFDLIVPCGIAGRKATSLEKLLGRRVSVREVSRRITERLGEALGLEMLPASPDELAKRLREFESGATNRGAREIAAMT